MPRHQSAEPTAAEPTRAWVLHPDLDHDRRDRSPEHVMAEAMALARALPALDVVGGNLGADLFDIANRQRTTETRGHFQPARFAMACGQDLAHGVMPITHDVIKAALERGDVDGLGGTGLGPHDHVQLRQR